MRAYIHAMNPRMRKKYLRKKIGWKDVIGLICILGGTVIYVFLISKELGF